MKKNDIIKLEITDIAVGGEGIGKSDGFPFFVKNAVIGDVAEAVITKLNKKYGYAKVLHLLEKSPWRVEPVCPKADQCGGCQIMQLDYKKQLEFKENLVRSSLTRIGGVDFSDGENKAGPSFLPIIGMEPENGGQPVHFRNKVQFPVGKNKEGHIVSGFYAGRTHYIIETDSCPVSVPVNDRIMAAVCRFLEEHHIPPYNETDGSGVVRHILIRNGAATGQIMICLVINANSLNTGKRNKAQDLDRSFVDMLLALDLHDFPGQQITSVSLNVNRKKTNVILGDKIIELFGKPYIEDVISLNERDTDGQNAKDLRFRISPLSFYQVNSLQMQKLYRTALEFADLKGEEDVWDLYCGTGTISLFLAQRAKQVYGVEIVPDAIRDAKDNARYNKITNAEFFCGDSAELFIKKAGGRQADVVVLDPPRKGCDSSLLEAVMRVGPEKIVYVSCDPATLARDIGILTGKNADHPAVGSEETCNLYEVKKVQAVDMFPHTCHIETIVLLQKLNS